MSLGMIENCGVHSIVTDLYGEPKGCSRKMVTLKLDTMFLERNLAVLANFNAIEAHKVKKDPSRPSDYPEHSLEHDCWTSPAKQPYIAVALHTTGMYINVLEFF